MVIKKTKKYLILATIECENPDRVIKELLRNVSSKAKILDITYVEYPV